MTVRVEGPAKLNLYLGVGERGSDGYHCVRTVLCALDLCDDITVDDAAGLRVESDAALGIEERDDLAWKAAAAFGAAVGRDPAFRISVRKRVPVGGGLGGGSSDAAAVIAALERLWDVAPGDPRTMAVACGLGADVPFLLFGGCALLEGRGDAPVRRLALPPVCFALVNPGVPLSTAAAYSEFDRLARPACPETGAMEEAIERGDAAAIGGLLFNGMAEASTNIVPAIADLLASLETAHGCMGATVAGSGSTVFGVFADPDDAAEAVRAATDRGLWARVARPRAAGTRASVKGVLS